MLLVAVFFIGTFYISESTDCSSQQTLQRQASDTTAPGYYEVQCDLTDPNQYEKKQCWPSTGRCWCVDTYGVTITGSHVNPGLEIDCERFGWCTSMTLTVMGNQTQPLLGAPTPSCDSSGNFALSQSWGSTGERWCAVPNGNEIPGTKSRPGEPAVDCENLPTCFAKEGTLAHLAVDNFYPLGLDRPECDPQGLFQAQQCHGSTGYCWCVDIDSGEEVEGTRKGPSEGHVSCEPNLTTGASFNEESATSCQRLMNTQTQHLLGADSPIVGFWTVSCEVDGSFTPSQCHPSTGMCWCVDEDGTTLPGSTSVPGAPRTPCGVSRTCSDIKSLQEDKNQQFNFVGTFVPECEDDGSFKRKQCWGSTGQCWCVSGKGDEISYSRRGPAEKPQEIDCTGAREPPKRVSSGKLQDEELEEDADKTSSGSSMIIIIAVLACLLVFVSVAAVVYVKRNTGPRYSEVNAEL